MLYSMLCNRRGLVCTVYLFNAAPPSLVCAVLEKYEEDFFKCVNAKIRLLKLIRKGVITEDIKVTIESVDDEDSKEILYRHLKCNANVDTLLRYCEVAIAAEGYPNMQALGWSMQEELQQGGWLSYV